MNFNILERFFNPKILIIFNLFIIIAAELSGRFIEESGLIHYLAIFFVLLGIVRIALHYNVYDQFLRPLVYAAIVALVVLAFSHVIEFFGFVEEKNYEEIIFTNIVNLYIASMFIIAFGAEYFIRMAKGKSALTLWLFAAASVFFLVLTGLIFFGKIEVSLEFGSYMVYFYILAILFTFAVVTAKLRDIKRRVSITSRFASYYIYSFVLLAIAALIVILYDSIAEFGIPEYQIVYISHFFFYSALTLMFLAFAKFKDLSGMYAGLQSSE